MNNLLLRIITLNSQTIFNLKVQTLCPDQEPLKIYMETALTNKFQASQDVLKAAQPQKLDLLGAPKIR